jgi:hypothetical protein
VLSASGGGEPQHLGNKDFGKILSKRQFIWLLFIPAAFSVDFHRHYGLGPPSAEAKQGTIFSMTWVAAADYRRASRLQERQQHPCQVYGKVDHISTDLMVGAIASGSPDAKLSHIGSKTAARAALNNLRQNMPAVRRAISDESGDTARALYSDMMSAVLEQLRAAAFDNVASVRDLATTLTVFAADPNGVAAMQIGDGLVVARSHGQDYSLIFGQRAEDPNNERLFVTSESPDDAMRVGVRQGPVNFLCAASETLRDLSLKPQDGLPQKKFFRPLDRYTSVAPDDSEVHRGIRSFLRSDRLNNTLDHDLGLALCGYRDQGELFRASAA